VYGDIDTASTSLNIGTINANTVNIVTGSTAQVVNVTASSPNTNCSTQTIMRWGSIQRMVICTADLHSTGKCLKPTSLVIVGVCNSCALFMIPPAHQRSSPTYSTSLKQTKQWSYPYLCGSCSSRG